MALAKVIATARRHVRMLSHQQGRSESRAERFYPRYSKASCFDETLVLSWPTIRRFCGGQR